MHTSKQLNRIKEQKQYASFSELINNSSLRLPIPREVLFIYLSPDNDSYLLNRPLPIKVKRIPKLGLQYLSSILENINVSTEIKDQTVYNYSVNDLIDSIKSNNHLFVGFYSSHSLKSKVIDYIKIIKSQLKSCNIIVGGPDHYSNSEYLMAGAEFVLHGESEITILNIVNFFNQPKSKENILGVSYLEQNKVVKTPKQPMIDNLDDLPYPKRTIADIKNYYNLSYPAFNKPFMTIIASRGCPFNCSFCSTSNIWDMKLRTRSPSDVIEEIKFYKSIYNIKSISFMDDVFGLNAKWLNEFCDLMSKNNLNINWSCMMQIYHLKSFDVLEKMKAAGCSVIIVGVQSSSQKVLKDAGRTNQDEDQLIHFTSKARKLRIFTKIQFIFGLPNDDNSVFKSNIAMALKARPNIAMFYPYQELSGSDLFNHVKKNKYSENALKKKCFLAYMRFFLDPLVILNNCKLILTGNTLWLLFIAKELMSYGFGLIVFKLRGIFGKF